MTASQDNQILHRIQELIADSEDLSRAVPALGDVAPHHRLVEDLQLDSITLLSLAVAVENEFEVAFSEEDDERIRTVDDLIEAVRRHRGEP